MPKLTPGDPAPWFIPASIAKQQDCQDITVGGYRVVLFCLGSFADPRIRRILEGILTAQAQFQQQQVTCFGVTIDPRDQALKAQVEPFSHFRFLWDLEGELSINYGICQLGEGTNGGIDYDPTTFILDENLRVLDVIPLETHVPHVERVLQSLQQMPTPVLGRSIQRQAPVLLIPQVFPADFCQFLINQYEADGGTESGFMKQEADKAVVTLDYGIKRRRDWMITDPGLLSQINYFIARRVKPEVEKAFQFRITCFERYLVGCYEANTKGFFKPHRDNVNAGAAHRRFAMTLNLNDGYEGGCLRFPEYSSDLYSPPPGGVALFSCSLLHEVTPVTQGRRFALLSFFYNDADAQLREQTRRQIVRQDGSTALFDAGNQAIDPSTSSSLTRPKETLTPGERSSKPAQQSTKKTAHKSAKKTGGF